MVFAVKCTETILPDCWQTMLRSSTPFLYSSGVPRVVYSARFRLRRRSCGCFRCACCTGGE